MTVTNPEQRKLPVETAAAEYHLPVDRISRAVSAGEVTGHQVGRTRFVDRGSLEEWIGKHPAKAPKSDASASAPAGVPS